MWLINNNLICDIYQKMYCYKYHEENTYYDKKWGDLIRDLSILSINLIVGLQVHDFVSLLSMRFIRFLLRYFKETRLR